MCSGTSCTNLATSRLIVLQPRNARRRSWRRAVIKVTNVAPLLPCMEQLSVMHSAAAGIEHGQLTQLGWLLLERLPMTSPKISALLSSDHESSLLLVWHSGGH